MKGTKIMLGIILTGLCIWTLFAFIAWMLTDLTFKESYTSGGVLACMILFGWIPSIIVAIDLEDYLD